MISQTLTPTQSPPTKPKPHSHPPITGEELLVMREMSWTELVEGEIIQHIPTGFLHGRIEALIATLLSIFVRKHKLGVVFGGETGIYTRRNPDTVRGVDVAYISHERLAQSTSHSYLDVAPELVVEVMSPNDSWTEIDDKLDEYFGIGVQLIWIVNPKRQQIHIYTAHTKFEILGVADTLTGGSVLDGFAVAVSEIFES